MLLLCRRHAGALLALVICACPVGASNLAAENSNWALLGNRAVQRELQLSEEQQAKVDAILKDMQNQLVEELNAKASIVVDKDKFAELIEQIKTDVSEKYGQRFMALLNNEQQVRFWQIGMQAYGRETAFSNNRVQRLLSLTDTQLKEIDGIVSRIQKDVRKLATDPNLDDDTLKGRFELAKKACLDSELKLLTEKQRKDFDEVMGKPFDLDLLQRADGVKPKALTFIFPMRGGSAYFLLGSSETQQKLGLSPEQVDQIDKILRQVDRDLTDVRLGVLKKNEKDFPDLSLAEKRRTVRTILDGVKPVHQEATRQFLKVLTREQAAKLDEQSMRILGPRAIEAESIATRLQLSDEQKSAFAKLIAEFDEATAPLVVVRRRSDLDKSYDVELEKLNTALRAILTEQQRQILEENTPK